MDLRPHEIPGKSTMLRHRDRMEDSSDHRPSEGPIKRIPQDQKRPFRRVRSPSMPRVSASFKPRFGGRFYRPRLMRDEHPFRKPTFGFGFQRYHHLTPRYHWRDHPRPRPPAAPPIPGGQHGGEQRAVERSSPVKPKEHTEKTASLGLVSKTKPVVRVLQRKSKGAHEGFTNTGGTSSRSSQGSSSREKEKPCLSFTVCQESEGAKSRERGREREIPSTLTRATARNRAIQEKRREIEEVYRQDCDTFGVVVRMLIAKDPALERPIQSSLQENLREIGLRCVEAMQHFIDDYDSTHTPK